MLHKTAACFKFEVVASSPGLVEGLLWTHGRHSFRSSEKLVHDNRALLHKHSPNRTILDSDAVKTHAGFRLRASVKGTDTDVLGWWLGHQLGQQLGRRLEAQAG